jgi:hypothetical protein
MEKSDHALFLIDFPDEAEQQNGNGRYACGGPEGTKVNGRQNQQVEHNKKIAYRQEYETSGAPEQQARTVAPKATHKQSTADHAGDEAQRVNGGC